MICGGGNGSNGSHLAVCSENTAFACHFVAQTLPPYGSASGIGYASKNYLAKWWEIQLAIQCNKVNNYRFVEKQVQAALTILEIY